VAALLLATVVGTAVAQNPRRAACDGRSGAVPEPEEERTAPSSTASSTSSGGFGFNAPGAPAGGGRAGGGAATTGPGLIW